MKHRLNAQHSDAIQAFDLAKQKMYKHFEQAEYEINQKPSEKDLSYVEYYKWLDRATWARDEYLAGKLDKAEALNVLKQV